MYNVYILQLVCWFVSKIRFDWLRKCKCFTIFFLLFLFASSFLESWSNDGRTKQYQPKALLSNYIFILLLITKWHLLYNNFIVLSFLLQDKKEIEKRKDSSYSDTNKFLDADTESSHFPIHGTDKFLWIKQIESSDVETSIARVHSNQYKNSNAYCSLRYFFMCIIRFYRDF